MKFSFGRACQIKIPPPLRRQLLLILQSSPFKGWLFKSTTYAFICALACMCMLECGAFFLCLYQCLSPIVLVWIFHYENLQTYSKVEGRVWHLRYLSLKFNHYHTWSEFHFIITLLPFLLRGLKSLLIYRVPWLFFFFWYFVYYRSWVICSMLFHLLDFVARPWHWSLCPLCPVLSVNGG